MRYYLALLLVFLLNSGCTETITQSEPLPTGTLVGRALLYDGKMVPSDNSGIMVSLEGTGFRTVTDANGEWRFDHVPTRTYNIVYEKEGYGLMKTPMFSFLGGGVVRSPAVMLTAIPECGSIFDDLRQVDSFYIEAYAHAPCSVHDSQISFVNDYFIFAFANTPDVSIEEGKHKYTAVGASGMPRGIAGVQVYKDQLERFLDLDDSIYVAVYHMGSGSYVDPLTERTIYTSINKQRDRTLAVKWRRS